MESVMADKDTADKRTQERKEIEDWMNGSGGKVLGGILLLLGLWFVVGLFW